MNQENQLLQVEIKLADRILNQYQDLGYFLIQSNDDNIDKIARLLKVSKIHPCITEYYQIIPGEGIWPYEGAFACPCYYATSTFDPIPLIIGLEKIREFIENWNPDED